MAGHILENFSSNYRRVLGKSINLAWQLKTKIITPEYLLYALFLQKGSLGSEILVKAALKEETIKRILPVNSAEKFSNYLPEFDSQTIKIIEKSAVIAFRHNHPYVATEHLLLAIIEENKTKTLEDLFKTAKINPNFIKNQLQAIFNSTSKFHNFASSINNFQTNEDEFINSYATKGKTAALDTFTTDLTNKDIQSRIDPLIGRHNEINRLIEILMRRTKNNPLLLGDPGVGKTALVEGLAKRIINRQVPEVLLNKKILYLDISLIVAGTMFRGEFENRMKIILEEIKKDPDIIIFIDEIHNIIGAGSTQGSMDIANIIKPALARGEIRCIGATTYEEYKKHLESDAALERRFQLIKLKQPSPEETVKIIEGVKNNYEIYHGVAITSQAVEAAVALSDKYITDRFFPDKALDLIDEAAARIKVNQKLDEKNLELKKLTEELADIKQKKKQAIIKENFKQAILLKKEEKNLQEKIIEIEKRLANKNNACPKIQEKEICQIIASIINVPVRELLAKEKDKLLKLEKTMSRYIIGQDQALKTIAQAIRRAKSGITANEKPLASFIFSGPSGSGKTYTAKIVSQMLYNDPKSLIRIDMSEFTEKFNISKLIGAPAGYVGYKESSKLTDAVKRNPNSIVLFDEIEKAHPDIFNLLLQILDEGYITDAVGKKINFKNTIIIMTSNLGSDKLGKNIGFSKDSQNGLIQEEAIKKFFPPEFVNRLDKIIIFNKLEEKDLLKIIKIELEKLQNNLKQQKIIFEIDKKTHGYLLQQALQNNTGARAIRQNIEELIETPLAELILSKPGAEKKFVLNLINNRLNFTNG